MKCEGSDIIRIIVKGYLKNITENELLEFKEKGIKNKDKISFINDNVKYNIRLKNNEIMLVRDGTDFINTFLFRNKNSKCNYLIKENNYDVDMDIVTKKINISDNIIDIWYEITTTGCEYEFKIEMSDI